MSNVVRGPNHVWAWCVILLMVIACSESTVPAAPTVKVAPTIEQRLIGLADGLQSIDALVAFENPSLMWQFEAGGGQALLNAVAADGLDAALVHYLPFSAESLYHTPIALDGVVLIVHPSNPITDLSLGEIQAVFSGDITNWSAVGGSNAPISLLLLDTGSGMRELLASRVMGARRVSVNSEIRPNIINLQGAVANNPNAIGVSTYSSLTTDVRALTINNIAADPVQFETQQYPLTTPVYWVSKSEPIGEIRGLLAYLQSDEGQGMLEEKFGSVR